MWQRKSLVLPGGVPTGHKHWRWVLVVVLAFTCGIGTHAVYSSCVSTGLDQSDGVLGWAVGTQHVTLPIVTMGVGALAAKTILWFVKKIISLLTIVAVVAAMVWYLGGNIFAQLGG